MEYNEMMKRLMAVTGESELMIRTSFKENSGEEIETILDTITDEDIENWEV